ncbi:hypothetical protein AciM339_0738 [Aciduliprofundum sp. MAR08-339]|nr:hypothetical protein AciM339_0738 [Aciduliprofundum sp. MAR08-339]
MLLSVLIPFSAFAENNNLGTTHGNAIFLKKVTLERKDVYGNAVDCVLEAYFVYGDYGENSIVYICLYIKNTYLLLPMILIGTLKRHLQRIQQR